MKNNDENDQIITKAVNWWIEKLENPVEKIDSNEDEAIKELTLTMLSVINEAKAKNEITQEKLEIFKISLTEQLEDAMTLRGECILRTNYEPMWQLKEAALVAKIDPNVFPWNIIMRVNKEKIEVSEGLIRSYKTIYKVQNNVKTKRK